MVEVAEKAWVDQKALVQNSKASGAVVGQKALVDQQAPLDQQALPDQSQRVLARMQPPAALWPS